MASWERQEGETEKWYDRFCAYLLMGDERTVVAARTFASRLAIGAARGQLSSWQRAARRHHWKEARAAAYDADRSHKAMAGDERLRMVVTLLDQVYLALCNADIAALPKEEVRHLLPTFRLFFRDLLQFHQSATAQWLAANPRVGDGGGVEGGAEMSADDFVAMLSETGGLRALLDGIKGVMASPATESSRQPLCDVLASLYPDEASARRIADQAQLDSTRIHFSARVVDCWHALLTEADHAGLLEKVIQVVRSEYGANREFVNAVRHYQKKDQ